jgi:FixJ family two-component response regulator
VLEGSDGEEVLRSPGRSRPGRLLTDVVMRGLDGRALAEQAASIRPEIRVLFMSGYSDDTVSRHGVDITSPSFIRKPFSMETLATKVRELLKDPNQPAATR